MRYQKCLTPRVERKGLSILFNRQSRPLLVRTYGGVSEYGEQLAEVVEERTIDGTFGLYTHTNVDDIRYNDVEYTILTKDKQITTNDRVLVDGIEYKVLFVNNYGRLSQLFLK